MGLDWLLFRIKYLYLQKSHYFDKINIKIIHKSETVGIEKFKLPKIDWINSDFKGSPALLEKADHAIKGEIFSFSHEYLNYRENGKINWNMNPVSKEKANSDLNWNQLPDFGKYGDIKLIWEASRFPHIYYFINAYASTKDEKYAKACLNQIIDWIDNNPYPKGVNYKCGQEITFRIIAWMTAIDYFRDFLSEEDEITIVKNIYLSILRVDANIDYAARAVKNNHSLSESIGLILFGLHFKQFNESEKLLKKGIRYLLKETAYQVYADGSYIQHSFTYQRLALDILSFVIMISEKKGLVLPVEIKERHQQMIHFLNAFIQENGWLPNYGSNDGANLFPVSNDNYRDFRSSLNFAQVVNSKSKLFDGHSALLDLFGLKMDTQTSLKKDIAFNDGGYYILKNDHIFSFTRCHTYRDRPASNDMLHLDIWYEGKNIFCDTGSYSYNTDKNFKNNFIGVLGHNTIMINNTNQMQQVLNFGYSNWTKAKCIKFDTNRFVGINTAYQKEFGIIHERTIALENNKLKIVDDLKDISSKTDIKQIWNTKYDVEVINTTTLRIENCIISSNVKYKIEESYISDYYNSYVLGKRIIFEIEADDDSKIITTMEFK